MTDLLGWFFVVRLRQVLSFMIVSDLILINLFYIATITGMAELGIIVYLFLYVGLPNFVSAQVLVDSEGVENDVFVSSDVTEPDSLSALFFWVLLVFAVFSFALFWRNRHIFISIFSGDANLKQGGAPKDAPVFLNEREIDTLQKTKSRLENTDSNENKVEMDLSGVNIHDIDVDNKDELDTYTKPELKLVMEEDGPRLIFK